MNKKVYGVRDTLACETNILLTEKNDDLLKRIVMALLLERRPNPINSNTKDTQIFQIGELDTESGILTACTPRMALNVEVCRQELLAEIRMTKALAGEKPDCDKLPVEVEEEKEINAHGSKTKA